MTDFTPDLEFIKDAATDGATALTKEEFDRGIAQIREDAVSAFLEDEYSSGRKVSSNFILTKEMQELANKLPAEKRRTWLTGKVGLRIVNLSFQRMGRTMPLSEGRMYAEGVLNYFEQT